MSYNYKLVYFPNYIIKQIYIIFLEVTKYIHNFHIYIFHFRIHLLNLELLLLCPKIDILTKIFYIIRKLIICKKLMFN